MNLVRKNVTAFSLGSFHVFCGNQILWFHRKRPKLRSVGEHDFFRPKYQFTTSVIKVTTGLLSNPTNWWLYREIGTDYCYEERPTEVEASRFLR